MTLELSGTMLASLGSTLSTLVSPDDLHMNLEVLELLRPTLGRFPERVGAVGNQQGVVRIMELLHEGVMLIDVAGSIVYENPALRRLVTTDPEAPILKTECLALAQRLLSLARQTHGLTAQRLLSLPRQTRERATSSERSVRTASAGYRIRGAIAEPLVLADQPISVVMVARTTPEQIPPEVLQSRYDLTPREAVIALQLAQGRSNAEIAKQLRISPNTVRRHVERVLPKLGVHSRAAVAAKLTADS